MRPAVPAIVAALIFFPAFAHAAVHEAHIPLHDGQLRSADLSQALLEKCHVKGVALSIGSIDLNGVRGSLFVKALDTSLGDGANVALSDDGRELVLRVDP